MQTDPLGFSAGDQDLYRYCSGEYSMGYDPLGLFEVFGVEINPFHADGWREVGNLFGGGAQKEDQKWEANIARASAACFKAARELRDRGETQRASELECVCRNNQAANHQAVQQVADIRQQQWKEIGDTARNAIVATVGVFVAPATLLGQVAFNVMASAGLEAIYGGDWREAAIDGAFNGVFAWGIGRIVRGIAGVQAPRGLSRHTFWDSRPFRAISREHWNAYGPANGRSLHHWLVPQRAAWIPQGLRNARFNLMELPPIVRTPFGGLNQWMGMTRSAWGATTEWGIRLATPLGVGAGYSLGSKLEDWIGP